MGSNTVIDITGKIYGEWSVVDFSHKHPISGNAYWNCVCSCGNRVKVDGSRLRKGKTTKCKACHGRTQMRHIKYRQNKANDLYMIQCGEFIKIGVTDNIKVRLTSIQSGNPYPVKLVGFWKGEGWREQMWHEHLKEFHHSGEWFKLGSCEI
jgi:hypothetical protein